MSFCLVYLTLHCRQATGGTVAVFNNVTNEVWMFMKEISSDGDVSTVSGVYVWSMTCKICA